VIGIIDYGIGNINAFRNIYYENGIDIKVIDSSENFDLNLKKIILPGVGSYDYAMYSLKSSGLLEKIDVFLKNEKNHLLGICLGMQILSKLSDEGLENGIGIFDKKIKKFENIPIPHMGWNTIKILKNDIILKDIPDNSEFYFLHSYFFQDNNDNEDTISITSYNNNFSSIVKKKNIYGIQFHPEKSHELGGRLLLNFFSI
jgi:imidazole glycerol-phosphate synthase subunit HisH